MGRVYLVRHGETSYNRGGQGSDKIRSHADIPLNKEGLESARKLGNEFKDDSIVAIYSSDLGRSADTAEEIKSHHQDATLKETKKLRSWDMGHLTGKLTSPEVVEQIQKYVKDDTTAPKDGESFKTFVDRLLDYVKPIFEEAQGLKGDDCIVIVTHGRCVQVIDLWCEAGCDEECLHRDYIDELSSEPDDVEPGGYLELRYNDGEWARYKTEKELS